MPALRRMRPAAWLVRRRPVGWDASRRRLCGAAADAPGDRRRVLLIPDASSSVVDLGRIPPGGCRRPRPRSAVVGGSAFRPDRRCRPGRSLDLAVLGDQSSSRAAVRHGRAVPEASRVPMVGDQRWRSLALVGVGLVVDWHPFLPGASGGRRPCRRRSRPGPCGARRVFGNSADGGRAVALLARRPASRLARRAGALALDAGRLHGHAVPALSPLDRARLVPSRGPAGRRSPWEHRPGAMPAAGPLSMDDASVSPRAPRPIRQRGHRVVKVLVTGAAGFINGYLVPELLEAGHEVDRRRRLQQVRAARPLVRRPPALPVRRGRREGRGAAPRARRRLRPGRRRGRDDRRDQLLPRVRLRPAGRERADPRRRPSTPRSTRTGTGTSSGSSSSSSRWSTSPRRSSRRPRAPSATSPPPVSTYGFQKLASEYFAPGAWEQYRPAVHDRPAVQLRRHRRAPGAPRHRRHERQRQAGALATSSRTSCSRCLKGQDPLHILGDGDQVRHYTYGGDLARGIRLAMESPAAVNDDFNLSTAASTTVLELAEAIWRKVHDRRPRRSASSATRRSSTTSSDASPTSRKARDVLGFEATTSLDAMLDEVIPWIRDELAAGRL